jgi:hypothetical protein
MTEIFFITGVATAICAGWLLVLLAIFGLVRLSNWVSHKVLDCYGGWKTFKEYRSWYFDRKPEPPVPTSFMEMVTANLVREGVNKHRARELAEHFYANSRGIEQGEPND